MAPGGCFGFGQNDSSSFISAVPTHCGQALFKEGGTDERNLNGARLSADGAFLHALIPLLAQAKNQTVAKEKNMMLELTKGSAPAAGRLALAVTWEAKEGEAEAVADILRRMASAVKSEPGTLLFWPHRSPSNDRLFFLYELFADNAAFAAHQQTDHFKTLVLGGALPKLARRERVQFMPLQPSS